MYRDYYGFAPYVSVSQKKARAEKTIKKLQKKMQIEPVRIEGRAISKTWWGKSWNSNLERYADYNYRLERGRSYVRTNAVVDLKIVDNNISALVKGSALDPYEVNITINPLNQLKWSHIKEKCSGKIESLQFLAQGNFNKELQEIFFVKDTGLFPCPNEISFQCNCLDSAGMCKHVAATLYAIGNRLDSKPLLLFKMRSLNIDELISKSISSQTEKLIEKSQVRSKRIIDNQDIGNLFGINIVNTEVEDENSSDEKPISKKTLKSKTAKKVPSTSIKKSTTPSKSSAKPKQTTAKSKPAQSKSPKSKTAKKVPSTSIKKSTTPSKSSVKPKQTPVKSKLAQPKITKTKSKKIETIKSKKSSGVKSITKPKTPSKFKKPNLMQKNKYYIKLIKKGKYK